MGQGMLAELYIRNFAIIGELHLSFHPGFNVLTGETGAGKSIIIDAVNLLLGGRARADVIRSGTNEALVEGIFILNEAAQRDILPLLRRDGLEGEDEKTLILSREIRREGRSICRVNGRAVTLKFLEEIGRRLVDIHGQSGHLSLLRVKEHLDFLDRYGGLWPLRERVGAKVKALREVRQELERLQRDEKELARRVDLLRHQVEEITAAKLRIGEEEELKAERTRLANAERLTELADEAYQALYEGQEGQPSAIDLLGQVVHQLAELERIDSALREGHRMAEEVYYQMEELARTLRTYRDRIEYNPHRLQEVEERLSLIYNLKRKYGDSIAEILAFGKAAEEELSAISHSEERIEELKAREDELLHEIGELAARLSSERRRVSERLAEAVEAELADLNMERARFAVSIEQTRAKDGVWVGDERYAFDATGIDKVEFLIAPNVGEPFKPLAQIASGGEASRLMLALKTVLSEADEIPVLIFDEIDSGIGGRTGGVVGRKLWTLTLGRGMNGIGHQVLCVTHLPQLASYGDLHFKVSKAVVGGRTLTSARGLAEEERLIELAQMLGADTELTRRSAEEMLKEVRRFKEAALSQSK